MLHKTFGALALALVCLASPARAAGIQLLDSDPKLHGIIWAPCAAEPATVPLGSLAIPGLETLPGVKDCPIKGAKLPLVVISHGRGGWVGGHHDVGEALADAGFIVVGINHPGDSVDDRSQSDDASVLASRPADMIRLLNFMLNDWKNRTAIDPDRIGFFGFSKGGYTGLVLIGVDPDFKRVARRCTDTAGTCAQLQGGAFPPPPPHDTRIKAAVLADPATSFAFTPTNLADISIPVQIWRSEFGGNGVAAEGTEWVARSLPGHPEIHVVPAAHYAFLAPCSEQLAAAVPRICADTPKDFDRAAFHREFDAGIVRFFSEHLAGH